MAPMTTISHQVNKETGISVKLILFSNNRAALEAKIPAYLR